MKRPQPQLYIVGSVVAHEDEVPIPVEPPVPVTQDQLVEILTLEKKAEMLRRQIFIKRAKVAVALINGAAVEAGRHEATFNHKSRRVDISAFTGGIIDQPEAELPGKCLFKPEAF